MFFDERKNFKREKIYFGDTDCEIQNKSLDNRSGMGF